MIISFLIFVNWISKNFTFTKSWKNFYVSIISVMIHQNDVTTRWFRFWKGSSLIFFWWKYFLYVKLIIKQAWKIQHPESVPVKGTYHGKLTEVINRFLNKMGLIWSISPIFVFERVCVKKTLHLKRKDDLTYNASPCLLIIYSNRLRCKFCFTFRFLLKL